MVPSRGKEGRDCYLRLDSSDNICQVDCEGLYADVVFVKSTIDEKSKDRIVLEPLMAAYKVYKEKQITYFLFIQFNSIPINVVEMHS